MKKLIKYPTVILLVSCYLYLFILNNFGTDLLGLNGRFAYRSYNQGHAAEPTEPKAPGVEEVDTVLAKPLAGAEPPLFVCDTASYTPALLNVLRAFGLSPDLRTELKQGLAARGTFSGFVMCRVKHDPENFTEHDLLNNYGSMARPATTEALEQWWPGWNRIKLIATKRGFTIHLLVNAPVEVNDLVIDIPSNWELTSYSDRYDADKGQLRFRRVYGLVKLEFVE